jgi:phosphoribosylanthranilate isomerase
MRIKVCGITTLNDALLACKAGADALGFVFAPEARKRNRYIAPDDARAIIAQLPPFITSVAVCVNESLEQLRQWLVFVDRVQLHGEESPDSYAAVADRAIKAVRVGQDFDITTLQAHPAAAFLLDACVSGERGGTGSQCDWTMARSVVEQVKRPVILAGGLTSDNVVEAIGAVRPAGVDVSGGVESEPGRKDPDKIREFIQNARRA